MRSCCVEERTAEAAVELITDTIDARGPDSNIISPHFDTPRSMVELSVDTARLKQEIIAELLPVLRDELRAEVQALVLRAWTSRGCEVSVPLWGEREDTVPRATADTLSPATIKPVAVIDNGQSMQAPATSTQDAGGRNLIAMGLSESSVGVFMGDSVRKVFGVEELKSMKNWSLHSMCVSSLLELDSLSSPLGKGLRYLYVLVVVTNIFIMLAFASWGIVKIHQPEKYAEVQHEMESWNSGAGPLPRIAVSKPNEFKHAWNISLESCTILDGDLVGKVCNEPQFLPCDWGDWDLDTSNLAAWGGDWFCLPTDLGIQGMFGDPKYTYVKLDMIIPPGTAWEETGLSLNWEQKMSPFAKVGSSSLYTVFSGAPSKIEIFFQKVTAQVGKPFGFAGRMGNDESETLLEEQVYLKRSHEITRSASMKESDRALSIYLRADLFEVKDFYEVYSVLRMMESLGGLWTSFTFVVNATFLAPAFLLVKYLRHRHRRQDNQV